MKEVIFMHIGQCGNNIGTKFWDIVSNEHGLNEEGIYKGDSDIQLNKIEICFRETSSGRFIPRSIIVDLDPASINDVKHDKYGQLFHPDNFISSTKSTGNNFAKGFYSDGSDLIDVILETIRKEAEYCNNFQAFQMFHSLGGGTGSGLGCLIYNRLTEDFPDRIQSATSVLPCPKHSEVVTESYNAMLSLDLLMTNSHLVEVFDNDALGSLIKRHLKIGNPTLGDLNYLMMTVISSISSNLRFPGQLNSDYRKLNMNLVPFPRFIFLVNSLAPLSNRKVDKKISSNLHQIMTQLFDCQNVMIQCDPRKGKYIAAATLCRGHISIYDIENEVINFQNKNYDFFVDWVPSNIKVSCCDIAPRGTSISATFTGNNTCLESTFFTITNHYMYMFRRKAFVHWYLTEGLEEEEFYLAEDNLLNLIDDYQRVSVRSEGDYP